MQFLWPGAVYSEFIDRRRFPHGDRPIDRSFRCRTGTGVLVTCSLHWLRLETVGDRPSGTLQGPLNTMHPVGQSAKHPASNTFISQSLSHESSRPETLPLRSENTFQESCSRSHAFSMWFLLSLRFWAKCIWITA